MESKKFIFIFTLLLVAFVSDTSACGSRRGRHSRGHSSSHWHWNFGSSHSSSNHHSSSSHSSGSSHSSSHPSSSSHTSGSSHSSGHPSGSSHSSGHPSGSSHSSGYPSGSSHNSVHSGYDPRPSHASSDSHPSSHVNHESHQPSHQSSSDGHNSHNSPYYPLGYNPLNHHHHHHYVPGSSNHETGSSGTDGQNIQNNLYPAEEEAPSVTTKAPVKEDVSWLQLSCKEGLCEFAKIYPLKEVESAVEEMNKVLSTNNLSPDAKHINKYVRDFFLTPNTEVIDIKVDNSTEGCREETTTISPLGGYDIHGQAFIIVNLPKLTQKIKSSKCRTYDFCKPGVYVPYPWLCNQSYREEELLVLPVKQGSFIYTEFNVKLFKVPNRCQCISMDQMLNVHIHRFD